MKSPDDYTDEELVEQLKEILPGLQRIYTKYCIDNIHTMFSTWVRPEDITCDCGTSDLKHWITKWEYSDKSWKD
jgi:hypothetical protein